MSNETNQILEIVIAPLAIQQTIAALKCTRSPRGDGLPARVTYECRCGAWVAIDPRAHLAAPSLVRLELEEFAKGHAFCNVGPFDDGGEPTSRR